MRSEHAPRDTIQDELLEPRHMRPRESIKHGAVCCGQADIKAIWIVRGHLQNHDIAIALACLLLSEAKPAHLIMSMQEIGPIRGAIIYLLAHDGTRGISPAFTRLEYLHGSTDQIPYCVNTWDRSLQLLID